MYAMHQRRQFRGPRLVELHAGAVHGLGHAADAARNDRHPLGHRLDHGEAITLVAAGGHKQIGPLIVRLQAPRRSVVHEAHRHQVEFAGEHPQHREIARAGPLRPDQDQLAAALEALVIPRKGLDQLLHALVGRQAPHEQDLARGRRQGRQHRRIRRHLKGRGGKQQRQDAHAPRPERGHLRRIECAVRPDRVRLRGHRRQFAPGGGELLRHRGIEGPEKLRRRDVVVDHDLGRRRPLEHLGGGRLDGIVIEQQLPRGRAEVLQRPHLRPGVGAGALRRHEDVGRHAQGAAGVAQGDGLQRNRIAGGKARGDLVNRGKLHGGVPRSALSSRSTRRRSSRNSCAAWSCWNSSAPIASSLTRLCWAASRSC
jgi:hypothetical protein